MVYHETGIESTALRRDKTPKRRLSTALYLHHGSRKDRVLDVRLGGRRGEVEAVCSCTTLACYLDDNGGRQECECASMIPEVNPPNLSSLESRM